MRYEDISFIIASFVVSIIVWSLSISCSAAPTTPQAAVAAAIPQTAVAGWSAIRLAPHGPVHANR